MEKTRDQWLAVDAGHVAGTASSAHIAFLIEDAVHDIDALYTQRDQLAEALEGMLQIYGGALDYDYLPKSSVEMDCIDQARAALAAVNGE